MHAQPAVRSSHHPRLYADSPHPPTPPHPQTQGLKHGKAVVVCTLAAASSMVSGVLVGLLALGEALPHSGPRRALRVLSWVLILVGVTNLSSAGEGEGGGGGGLGLLRRAEESVRGAHALPAGVRLPLLSGLRVLNGGSFTSAAKRRGGGGGGGSSLLANGHEEDGPALPVVAGPAAAADGHGGHASKD